METDRHLKLEKRSAEYNIGRQLLIYTLLFIIAALGAYSFYIIGHSVFVTGSKSGNKDGITQIIPSYIAVKHIVHGFLTGDGFSAWNWSIGLGGDNWNMFASKLANPFTYMIIAFPEDKIDLSYTLVSVFRQYCVGVAFLFFGRKVNLTANQNILGALCYAFSMWMFMTIPDQAGFNTAALLFPLLMLGCEKIIDNESPLIFIISVFYFLTAGVVWGYASGIMIVIYFFLRMIMKGALKEPKEFFVTTGRFLLCGIAGILVASFFVSEILMSMSAATTDTGSGKQTWFSLYSYLTVPKSLYMPTNTGANSYSGIGLPIIGVVLMPMIVKKAFKGKIEAIMAFALLIGTQIPAVCRAFNGFSYPSGRWFYMVAFFTAWAAISNFDVETFKSKLSCLIMELWLILTAGWVVVRYMYLEMDSRKSALAAGAGLILGTAIIIIGHIRAVMMSKEEMTKAARTVCSVGLALIMLITTADIAVIGVFDSFTHARDGVSGHAHVGDSYKAVMGTNEASMREVQERDKDFYRYSRMGGYYGVRTSGTMVNSSIALGTRPIYTGFSSAPSAWHDFNKVVGNCSGNYRRTLIDGNNNRAMLDYLLGVKYFTGSPSDTSIKHNAKASAYVPYGYGAPEDVGGYELFTNSHCMGLGTSFDQFITESELKEYPVHLREQVLMQTAVVPDSYADKLGGVKHASKDDIATVIEESDIELVSADGITVDPEKKQIEARTISSFIEVKTGNIKNRQVFFSFRNLRRQAMDYEEFTRFMTGGYLPDEEYLLFKDKLAIASYKNDPSFKITTVCQRAFRGGQVEVKNNAKNEASGVRSFNDVEDFDINLGYFEQFPGTVKFNLSNPGLYTYDDVAVYAVPMDEYDKNAATLDSRKYDISEWSDDYVKGTMSCEEDSIMYFSILKNKGWHIYVDGKEVDKINDVNISFTGAMLPAGEHEVELKYVYPYKYELVAATLAGLLLTVGIMIRYNRRKKLGQSDKH